MAFPLFVCTLIKRQRPARRYPVGRKYRNNMCPGMLTFVASHRLVVCIRLFLLAFFLCGIDNPASAWSTQTEQIAAIEVRDLPPEARETLALIRQGGPFPWPKDGSVFGNYEGVLPKRKRGYYHEFTVNTPATRGRGARRIVVGGNWQTSREIYYTGNHYASFSRIKE